MARGDPEEVVLPLESVDFAAPALVVVELVAAAAVAVVAALEEVDETLVAVLLAGLLSPVRTHGKPPGTSACGCERSPVCDCISSVC